MRPMKLLMFLSPRFSWRPCHRALDEAKMSTEEETVEDCAVIFVHGESHDPENKGKLMTKFIKNVKWIAKKRAAGNIVLHSFTHLSESKATPEFAREFLIEASGRLESAGYRVYLTPFGYSCAWEISVHGEPVAKVFKSL